MKTKSSPVLTILFVVVSYISELSAQIDHPIGISDISPIGKVIKIEYKNRHQFPNRQWSDVYLKNPPKNSFQGYPTNACWSRGGICVPVDLCPTMEFEVLIQRCNEGNLVCCKTWNNRHLKDFQHAGLSKLIARKGLTEEEVNEDYADLWEKSEKNLEDLRSLAH